MRTIGAKKENGWLNFFKSAITEFSPESVKNYRRKRQKSPLSVLQNSRKHLKINDLEKFYPISTFALQLSDFQAFAIPAWANSRFYFPSIKVAVRTLESVSGVI